MLYVQSAFCSDHWNFFLCFFACVLIKNISIRPSFFYMLVFNYHADMNQIWRAAFIGSGGQAVVILSRSSSSPFVRRFKSFCHSIVHRFGSCLRFPFFQVRWHFAYQLPSQCIHLSLNTLLVLQDFWISKQEYEEGGIERCLRKLGIRWIEVMLCLHQVIICVFKLLQYSCQTCVCISWPH